MPQMAPMSWLTLYTFFTISLIVIFTINYYLYTPKMGAETKTKGYMTKMMNWKW